MPFIKRVKPPCECQLPDPKDRSIGIGSEWQCDECLKVYRLCDKQRDGRFWTILLLPPSEKLNAEEANHG